MLRYISSHYIKILLFTLLKLLGGHDLNISEILKKFCSFVTVILICANTLCTQNNVNNNELEVNLVYNNFN